MKTIHTAVKCIVSEHRHQSDF